MKCNPGSPTPALAVRRDDVLIDNYREGKAKVLRNGSLVLPYVQPSDAGEYRCYDMSISPSRGPFMVDLSINGKLFIAVNMRTISTNLSPSDDLCLTLRVIISPIESVMRKIEYNRYHIIFSTIFY